MVSDDEKGSSRQAQPLKTDPNKNIRVQGWLSQHDGQEFSLWRAQVNSSPGDRELSTGRQRVDEGPNYDEDDKDEIANIFNDVVQPIKAFSKRPVQFVKALSSELRDFMCNLGRDRAT